MHPSALLLASSPLTPTFLLPTCVLLLLTFSPLQKRRMKVPTLATHYNTPISDCDNDLNSEVKRLQEHQHLWLPYDVAHLNFIYMALNHNSGHLKELAHCAKWHRRDKWWINIDMICTSIRHAVFSGPVRGDFTGLLVCYYIDTWGVRMTRLRVRETLHCIFETHS